MRRKQREQLESIYLRVMNIRTQLEHQYRRMDRFEWYLHNIEWYLHNMAPNEKEVLFSKPEMDIDEWYEENKWNLRRLAEQKGAL